MFRKKWDLFRSSLKLLLWHNPQPEVFLQEACIADNYDLSAHNQSMTYDQTTGLFLVPSPWSLVPAFRYPPYPPFIYFQNLADYFAAEEDITACR
jgi:hypothetical protein